MYEAKKTGEVSKADQKLLDIFAQDAFPAVEVSADDLVTVKMSSRFELTDVSIRESVGHSTGRVALGHAIQKAVNEAIREVAKLNARRVEKHAGRLANG
jgi:DNA-binding protein YbaB